MLLCPVLTPRACSNPCPLNQCCHLPVASSATPFSTCPQSFPASGSFPVGQVSQQVSNVLEFQHQSFQRMFSINNWLVWSPCCLRDSQESSQHHNSKASMLWHWAFFMNQLSHSYVSTGNTIALTIRTFVGKVMSLLLYMLSRFVISFLPRRLVQVSSVQFSQLLSRVWLFATPCTTACQASLSITNFWSPPKSMSIESVMRSIHLILCCPLLLLPSSFSSIWVFSKELVSSLHQVTKVLEFQLQHQSFQWTPRTYLL